MLWLFYVVLLVLVFALFWVLFTPVIILIDSEDKIYRVCQKGTFSMDLVPDEGFKVRFKVIGISLKFDEKREEKKSEKQRKRRIGHPVQLLRKCVKALSIKALNMDIDTDDVVLNAQLIPLAFFFSDSKQNRYIHINFEGRFFLYLLAQIRLNLILIAFVKHLLKR